ncbi:MAG: hypothetical protein QHI48_12465 [Bacteroidota bacterium]|nr:hypothetical protein [Bacteroidota bacterium]
MTDVRIDDSREKRGSAVSLRCTGRGMDGDIRIRRTVCVEPGMRVMREGDAPHSKGRRSTGTADVDVPAGTRLRYADRTFIDAGRTHASSVPVRFVIR